jgi:TPR repeat protein
MALAQMYLEGKATKRNPSAAYMWYLISERTATEMKEQISAAKRKLAESLTTEEILEAQQKASEGPKKIPHAISTSDYGASARRI